MTPRPPATRYPLWVHWHRGRAAWQVAVRTGGRVWYGGFHRDIPAAVVARNALLWQLYGPGGLAAAWRRRPRRQQVVRLDAEAFRGDEVDVSVPAPPKVPAAEVAAGEVPLPDEGLAERMRKEMGEI